MKSYEKKSFFTTVCLFFITLISFSSIVLYMYYEDRVDMMEQKILYQMKDYTFDFKGETFSLDIAQEDPEKKLFQIFHTKEGLCAYFQMPTRGPYLLKVMYAQEKADLLYKNLLNEILKFFVAIFILVLFISIGFAMYSIKPMKNALHLLEEFLKDLIHDLNTPAASILLNTRLLRKRGDFEEIERIELSANVIASLYKNLQILKPEKISTNEIVDVPNLIKEKVVILKKLYPRIDFIFHLQPFSVKSDKNSLERIIDNLITNACKYNKRNGSITLSTYENKIVIEDTGVGIRDTKKVYERYYKENARGLGLGMSIVKQLCNTLNIDIQIKSELNRGTQITLTLN